MEESCLMNQSDIGYSQRFAVKMMKFVCRPRHKWLCHAFSYTRRLSVSLPFLSRRQGSTQANMLAFSFHQDLI